MKAIRADLPREFESVELLILADYHYADPNSDHEAIKRDIKYVAQHDNAYAVLAGDLMDCALKSSLGDCYVNLSPMEELTACMDLMKPIAHKIVGIVSGNHEARHYKTNGVDMTRILARQLGVEDKYSSDRADFFKGWREQRPQSAPSSDSVHDLSDARYRRWAQRGRQGATPCGLVCHC